MKLSQCQRPTSVDSRGAMAASPDWKAPGSTLNMSNASVASAAGSAVGSRAVSRGSASAQQSTAPPQQPGSIFAFNSQSLDAFPLPSQRPGAKGKAVARSLGGAPLGQPPPTSGSAALRRPPARVLLETTAQALEQQSSGPASATGKRAAAAAPSGPGSFLAKALVSTGVPLPEPAGRGGTIGAGTLRDLTLAIGGDDDCGAAAPKEGSPATTLPPTTLDALMAVEAGQPGSPGAGQGGLLADRSGYFTNFVLTSELRTSEDALAYFLKKQTHKFPVKFLHLVPMDPGYSGFYPYDLVVVDQATAEASPMHYVMTATGMTVFIRDDHVGSLGGPAFHHDALHGSTPPPTPGAHMPEAWAAQEEEATGKGGAAAAVAAAGGKAAAVGKGAKPPAAGPGPAGGGEVKAIGGGGAGRFAESEALALGQWVTDRAQWRIIRRRLRFFSQYLPRKFFGQWVENVRFKQFARMRGHVSNSLPWRQFEALAPVARSMAAQGYAMRHTPLLVWEHPQKKTAFTPKVFGDVQAAEKVSAERALEVSAKAVADSFAAAGLELERRRLPPEGEDDSLGGPMAYGPDSGGGAPNPATVSIVGIRLRAEAAARREKEYGAMVAKLPVLGRLAQYVAFENLMAAAVRTALEGTEAINAMRRGVGLFECAVSFAVNEALAAELAAKAAAAAAEAEAAKEEGARGGKGKKGSKKKEEEKKEGGGGGEGGEGEAKKEEAARPLTEEEKEEAARAAAEAEHKKVVAAELVFSPTKDELQATLLGCLRDAVDLLAMQVTCGD